MENMNEFNCILKKKLNLQIDYFINPLELSAHKSAQIAKKFDHKIRRV